MMQTNRAWFAILTAALFVAGCGKGSSESGPDAGSDGTTFSGSSGTGSMPEGAVLPTPETIESGEYTPLSRPLFLYVRKSSLKENPAVGAFLNYYLSDEGQEIVAETGYVKLSPAQLEETRQKLSDADSAAAVAGDLKEEVAIDGSSTVYPISSAIAEEFSKANRGVRVPVGVSGTGNGFKKFIAGETDINDASRPIKDSEAASLKEKGIDYIELKIAIDGLTVVVNPQNDWVDGMTIDQLHEIWKPDSTVKKWSDVDPSWPDEEISLFGPDTGSGTFDYFTEEVNGEAGASRSDYQQNTDDNFLVTGVAADKYSLGYFGFAYYVENQDKLKSLAIAPKAE